MNESKAPEDAIRERPDIQRQREWAHGDGGQGRNCIRSEKLIYTDPNKLPDNCHNYNCGNGDWNSKGIVLRDQKTKNIVHRDV